MLLLGSSEAEQVHQLLPELSRNEAADLLAPESIGPNDRVWLDLSDTEPQRWNLIQEELPPLHRRVIECRARLVVIKPYGGELRPDFRQFRRIVESTPAAKVFRHLLRVEGLLSGEEPALPGSLSGAPSMAAIQQFIDYILDAKDQLAGDGDLASWITAAEERMSPREEHVTEALDKLTDAAQRALLLAVAMLHGAHADAIERAATTLLTKVQGESGTVLERPPLRERLTEIGVKPDSMRHVRFSRPGYDFAVRAFFWKHFPDLHGTIATWVRATIDSKELSEDERDYLVRAFVDQCLDSRYQDFWTSLIKDLTAEPVNPSRMTAATAVLRHGLRDHKSSRAFRQQIYRWSLAGDLSVRLAAVLIEACSEMASTHPEQAIVRLHHVTRHYPEQTVARETLTGLASSDPWLLSYFLARVADARTEEVQRTDATLFLDIADASLFTTRWPASRLIAQRQVVNHLAGGWALTFTWLPPETWAPVAREWLRSAANDSANRGVLLDVVVVGAKQRGDLLSALFGMAHRAEFRDVIADPLLERISAAQGIRLT
ncbi:MAG TPA: hypothetical protein VN714_32780 [Trebonia sp.]|nr:hypothetical protein [Trebonia sp.]